MARIKNPMVRNFLKGACVGGSMLVPGVSGGTMAMILGVYDRLISAVSSFTKNVRENAAFLGIFALGAAAGMLLFARPILMLIEAFPMTMRFFFIGAVAGGVPLMVRRARVRDRALHSCIYTAFGFLLVLALEMLPAGGIQSDLSGGIMAVLPLALAGAVSAVALVLPGISVSYMLLMLGLYDETMLAITQLYLPFLFPLGLGLILGVLLTTRALELAMEKFPNFTYSVILGFVLGSIIEVFPGLPQGLEYLWCAMSFAGGWLAIWLAGRLS